MKDKLMEYKEKLERGISEYMDAPVSQRSAEAVAEMVECWERICMMAKHMCHHQEFTPEDAAAWNAHMVNDDGSIGGHWAMEQTKDAAERIGIPSDHFTPYCWWTAMNMMYSDYCMVAEKYGVSTVEFYADMAKAFLCDKDGGAPREKMAAYYHAIAEED